MSSKKIRFGGKEVDKKEFYSSKQTILLDSVDINKIVVSNKWKINDTTFKYLCGYLNNNKRAYSQAYLEQCKYQLKKRKTVSFIDSETIDEDSNDSYEEISIE